MVKRGSHALHASCTTKAITKDFRNALVGKSAANTADQNSKKIKNIKRSMKNSLANVAKEVKALDDAVKKMEERSVNKGYIKNTETHKVHKTLTTINEAGYNAKTCCGWDYADKPFKWQDQPPTVRSEVCGTCLGAYKATLPE